MKLGWQELGVCSLPLYSSGHLELQNTKFLPKESQRFLLNPAGQCVMPVNNLALLRALLNTALHCHALPFNGLHFTALHWFAVHCIALQCTALDCTALHMAILQVVRTGNERHSTTRHRPVYSLQWAVPRPLFKAFLIQMWMLCPSWSTGSPLWAGRILLFKDLIIQCTVYSE